MATESVTVRIQDGIGTVTLNRPARLNAFDVAMLQELADAVRALAGDEAVRAIVLTGAGRAFCAGADVGVLAAQVTSGDTDGAMTLLRTGNEVVQLLRGAPKPVLCCLNGAAAGGGAGLALACDVRLAAESASMGMVFHRLGIHPDLGTSWFVPRLAGTAAALELFYSAEMVPAARCLALGLVNRVVPDAELAGETAAWAARLAALPPIAARLIKRAVYEGESGTLASALTAEDRNQLECFLSDDAAEGLASFGAKRIPVFHGR
jgi:2-(1,2-epoxy-1,2-dihydrophenyl)acetyl-CoA isomerase